MGDVVDLQGQPAHLENNPDFVADCCRYQEGILTEAAVKKEYRFTDDVWAALGDNEALIEAVEAEKIRRIRSGQQKRERAQQLVVRAPDVLGDIMLDTAQSARHRINSAKALNDFSANPSEGAPAGDKFVIQINLGSEVLKFDKGIAINPHDGGPDGSGATPQGVITATANKSWDGDDG